MNRYCRFCVTWSVSLLLSVFHFHAQAVQAAVVADSIAEFSGTHGQDGWINGYRNYTATGETENYNPDTDFTPFPGGEGEGDWDGFGQVWTGTAWDLNTEAAGPWTFQAEESVHPNGAGSPPGEEHWVIRRWVATEVTNEATLQLVWRVRKENTAGGNGVTGGIWVNGTRLAARTIAGNDGVGATRTNYARIKPGDKVDLVLTPAGTDGGRADGNDGSFTSLRVETIADDDNDGLPNEWENSYAPGNPNTLTGTGDSDGDGLTDINELVRGSNPTAADSDGDGLADGLETNTGTFVSATDTGTDPLRADTDGDGRSDGEEVKVNPTTNPLRTDTDADGFSDGHEANSGHNPADENENPNSTAIARSMEQFSGVQGENSWFHGYRNVTADGFGQKDYDPETAFVEFTEEQFTGSQWDLNTAAAAPWTELGPENTHPNGNNNGNVHWTVRRWEATGITQVTPLALHWHTRKGNVGGGNGVTGSLHINGKEVDKRAIAGTDGTGFWHTFYANVAPGDLVDLVLRPTGVNGTDADGSDGSLNRLIVDPTIPAVAIQPNGATFIPAGAGDTDGDGLPDVWERIYFPTDPTKLNATSDVDGDGLNDLLEFQRDTNPTVADTDGDGLSDVVETATGTFVSPTNTGSNPKVADTDGDGRNDRDEVLGTPTSDPTKADTDADGFSDPEEVAAGTNPNDRNDNPFTFVIANSIAEFSGVQGQNGWSNGYRNFTLSGEAQDYDPMNDFIPYPGGEGEGDWDGVVQTWTGTAWDLNTAAAGPWTFQASEGAHPNGANSPPSEEHWAIRRWVASEVTNVTPVAIIWRVRKENTAGDGVTGSLYVNGKQVDTQTIAGNNGTNAARRFFVNLQSNDIVDLALTPQGITTRGDGSDGSLFSFVVDKKIPSNPTQPDGTPFVPAGGTAGTTLEMPTINAGQTQITLAWNSSPNVTYTVQSSTNLLSWTTAGTVPSAGARTTFSEAIQAGQRAQFYRIRQ